ncbi:unknown [Acholeplasma sp. CAG:878]|nr:unknown [Acholeplasma sp. CAG:878]
MANGANQTWTTSWQSSDASGLYAQTVGSNKTYYFRGNPTNNYIKFAGKDYRILRVNEDGTIRIMLTSSIGNKAFNSTYNTYDKMYYTNSEIKTVVDNWFTTNITGDNASKVVSGNYFCEAARVAYDGTNFKLKTGSTKLTAKESYTPTFECTTDGNGKGVVTSKVGLVTYDEIIYAGGWYYVSGLSYPYYLNSGNLYWTMSPAGFNDFYAYAWLVDSDGHTGRNGVNSTYGIRPVLNLSADTFVSGSGTESDPYIVK